MHNSIFRYCPDSCLVTIVICLIIKLIVRIIYTIKGRTPHKTIGIKMTKLTNVFCIRVDSCSIAKCTIVAI